MASTTVHSEYRVQGVLRADRFTALSAPGIAAEIQSVTPPEFPGGIAGEWSPETLLLAAVAGCFLNTFQSLAGKMNFQPESLTCEATGTLGVVEGKFMFTEITLYPILTLADEAAREQGLKILEKAHRYCLISNSLKCPVAMRESLLVLAPA